MATGEIALHAPHRHAVLFRRKVEPTRLRPQARGHVDLAGLRKGGRALAVGIRGRL